MGKNRAARRERGSTEAVRYGEESCDGAMDEAKLVVFFVVAAWVRFRIQWADALQTPGDFGNRLRQFRRFFVSQLAARLRHIENVDGLLRFGIHQHHFDIAAPSRNQ